MRRVHGLGQQAGGGHRRRRVPGVAPLRIDDSDGTIAPLIRRAEELHLRACTVGGVGGVELARRLFRAELASKLDAFRSAARRWAGVLGGDGLAEFRRLAEREWEKLPALASEADWREAIEPRRRILEGTLVWFAERDGDAGRLATVMAKDLSSAYRYLEIARACLDLGDGELAVAWAERGMAAFPEFTDSRLREFLADRYLDRGRGEEALALDWALFVEDPGAERYTRLRRHAEALGVWPAWRERALDRVRPGGAGGSRDASRLVDLLLSEGDHDAAWAEANRHGCDSARWSALALARQAEHPGDAADAYRRQLAPTLAWASDAAYRDAVALLRLIRDLLSRAGRSAEFPSLVASLRRQHARRRKFLARLDRAGMG